MNEVLFWLRLELFSYAILIAPAYAIIGGCHTMKRERNGNHLKHTNTLLSQVLAPRTR